MGKNDDQILKAIKELGKQPDTILSATIKEVDEAAHSCTVVNIDDLEIFNVRIKAIIDEQEKGIIPIPKVDSEVTIGRFGESNEWQILTYSEIESYAIINDKSTFKIDAKFSIKNDKASLKKIISEILSTLKTATMGPYPFTPDVIAKFESLGIDTDNLMDE